MTAFRYFRENPNNPYRLGRHQVHDALDALPERQLERFVDLLKPIKTVTHAETQPVFDQGNLGSCTANAALGCLVTAPFAKPGVSYTEDDAVALYELETKLDDSQIPGEYPPDDTGSSGPWSMQALEKQGKVASFQHSRNVHVSLVALGDGPISIGIPWYQSMFQLDPAGRIVVDQDSGVAGGHQVCIVACDITAKVVTVRNSWGTSWGKQGHATLAWDDLTVLFAQGGDTVQPVVA
jgi:C1A family cysteine protease